MPASKFNSSQCDNSANCLVLENNDDSELTFTNQTAKKNEVIDQGDETDYAEEIADQVDDDNANIAKGGQYRIKTEQAEENLDEESGEERYDLVD